MKPPVLSVAFALAGILCFGAAVHFYVTRPAVAQLASKPAEITQVPDKPTQFAPGGIINNQTGGTSTNTVNNYGVQRPPRQLTDAIKAELLQKVPKDKKLVVGWVVGDGEAENFAMAIRAYLGANGYDLDTPSAVMAAWEVKPIELNADGPLTMLTVGKNK